MSSIKHVCEINGTDHLHNLDLISISFIFKANLTYARANYISLKLSAHKQLLNNLALLL